MNELPIRILLAKIGLDGHDRGVKVLARSFRDAGFDVIYTGLWQTAEKSMLAAMQEDVDVVGVSMLSAAHQTVMPEVLRCRKALGIEDVPVVLGGIVPADEHDALLETGIAAVFNPGSALSSILDKVRGLATQRRRMSAAQARDGYASGKDTALAQLITLIQHDRVGEGFEPPKGHAQIIGVTGSPGVGKSSFIGRLGNALQSAGKKVAVVAVDPSSPVNGGALLGDRLRMMGGEPSRDFFVRSVSSGKRYGGLGPRVEEIIRALDGFGFDYILVETVGAGQSDTAVREIVDRTLLLLMPESGDTIQFSKAGIMEIASAFVLNKVDLPGADATRGQLISAIDDERPIFPISTVRNEGIEDVVAWVLADS